MPQKEMCSRQPESESHAEKIYRVLGYEADRVVFYVFKQPLDYEKIYKIIAFDNQLNEKVIQARVELDPESAEEFIAILENKEGFVDWTSDWQIDVFAVVFFRGEKAVLEVYPNLAGRDVGCYQETILDDLAYSNENYLRLDAFARKQLARIQEMNPDINLLKSYKILNHLHPETSINGYPDLTSLTEAEWEEIIHPETGTYDLTPLTESEWGKIIKEFRESDWITR